MNQEESDVIVNFTNVDFAMIYDALITQEAALNQAKEKKELGSLDANVQIELCQDIRRKIDILTEPVRAAQGGMDS